MQEKQPHPKHNEMDWHRAFVGAKSRWPAFLAVFIVIFGQAHLANNLKLEPVWLPPSLAGVLLIISIGIYISPAEPDKIAQGVSASMVGVLIITNIGSLVLLVRGVFLGSTLSPFNLLASGVALWIINTLIFAIAYWELDGNGPEARLGCRKEHPDLVFPQQIGIGPTGEPNWQPSFGDYLYVSLTNSTAFSPTDTLPYSKRAKFAMGLQGLLSFAIVALLVARSVNIAQG